MEIFLVGIVALSALIMEALCEKKKVKFKTAFLLTFIVVSTTFFFATLKLLVDRMDKDGGGAIEILAMWLAMGIGIGIIAGVKCAFKSYDYDY